MANPFVSLEDKLAVITGASSGIGAAAAKHFVAHGMKVALGARRKDKLDALAGEITGAGGEAFPVELDVTDWSSVQRFAKEVEGSFGDAHLVFANAGTGGYGELTSLSVEDWGRTIATNLTGVFHTAKAFLPLLEGGRGDDWRAFAITASVSGTMGMAGASAYCASKWGVRGFAQSFALEAAEKGVRVFTVNPGYVNTRWHEDHPGAGDMVQPADVADLVLRMATLPPTALVDDVTLWPARMYSE